MPKHAGLEGAADPQCREESEPEPGAECDESCNGEHSQIETRHVRHRHRVRHQLRQQRDRRQRDRHTQCATHGGEDGALGDHLPREPVAIGADGGANRELLLSGQRPCDEEICEVGARDQQHAQGGRDQRDQKRSGLSRHLIAETEHGGAGLRVLFGILAGELRRDQLHFAADLIEGDSRLHPRDDIEVGVGAIGNRARRELEAGPQLGRARWKPEACRHHSDNHERLIVQHDRAAENRRIAAELAAPETVAQYDRTRGRRIVVGADERTAERRLDAEDREEVGAHHRPVVTLGLADADEIDRVRDVGGHAFDRRRPLLPVEKVCRRELDARVAAKRLVLPHPHEPIGLGERQCAHQHVIGNRKRRGRRADAQRRDDDRCEREAARVAQAAKRVADVLHEQIPVQARGVAEDVGDGLEPDAGRRDRA